MEAELSVVVQNDGSCIEIQISITSVPAELDAALKKLDLVSNNENLIRMKRDLGSSIKHLRLHVATHPVQDTFDTEAIPNTNIKILAFAWRKKNVQVKV
jgi:hypothetical protein